MIRLLSGENDYMLWQQLQQARDEFVAAHGEHSVSVLAGETITTADLPQLLQGASLFAPQKLTIIRDVSANKPVWESLDDYLENAGDIDLLLIETKPDKRTRTFKWLQKNADVQEFRMLNERDVVSWLRTHARNFGIELHHDEANFLVGYSGTEQWRLHHDIEKLALAGKPISRQLIETLIDPSPSASAFDLLDAVITGRRDDALAKLAIIRRTEDPYKFMGLLASQLFTLALAVHADGRSPQVIAQESSQHPYVVQKLSQLANLIDAARLETLVRSARVCDISLKSKGAEPWMVIEAMIGTLGSEKTPR